MERCEVCEAEPGRPCVNRTTGAILRRGHRYPYTAPSSGALHARRPLPKAPGDWVDLETCNVCGERYDKFSSSANWADALAELRSEDHDTTHAPFISHGPVLWRMRITKVTEWFARHAFCGLGDGDLEDPGEPTPPLVLDDDPERRRRSTWNGVECPF